MKPVKKYISLIIIFSLVFTAAACQKSAPKKPNTENQLKKMPKVIEEIEKDVIMVMRQADLIPYFNRFIAEKEKIQQERQLPEQGLKPQEGASAQPKPMTIEEGILTEILQKEKQIVEQQKQSKPPENIAETWQQINNIILEIYPKWNELEPILIQENISQEAIAAFENALNELAVAGIAEEYLPTIRAANNVAGHLPKLIKNFQEEVPAAVFSLKYLLRNVVLAAAADDYPAAQKSLEQLKKQGQGLKGKLIKNKAKTTWEQFAPSTANLQQAIGKQNLNLIKIHASIVMENIQQMVGDFKTFE